MKVRPRAYSTTTRSARSLQRRRAAGTTKFPVVRRAWLFDPPGPATTDCKSVIHRFDSDRRLCRSPELLTVQTDIRESVQARPHGCLIEIRGPGPFHFWLATATGPNRLSRTMSRTTKRLFCPHCRAETEHVQDTSGEVAIVVLVVVFTCFLAAPIAIPWFFWAVGRAPWHCQRCHR